MKRKNHKAKAYYRKISKKRCKRRRTSPPTPHPEAQQKRNSGTDTETVGERTMLNTTGIEPLGGELSEVSFTIPFDLNNGSDCFLEAKVLAEIQKHRDYILSALMKKTSRVLGMLQDGAMEKVMRLLHARLGNHGKRQCYNYLSLMFLMMLSSNEAATINDEVLESLIDKFASHVEVKNEVIRLGG